MKIVKLLLCILIYPIGMSIGVYQSLRRWIRNFDMSEVSTTHRQWKELVKEALHPGHAAWEDRKRIASMCNMPFTEKEP